MQILLFLFIFKQKFTMETTVIKTFNDSFEANLALAKLAENGISAILENDTLMVNPGNINNQFILLKVMNYDVEKALLVLDMVEME